MKKFFGVMILVATLVVVGQVSKVEAAEVYMGSYSDGTAVYLLTHTISSTGTATSATSAPAEIICTIPFT